MTDAEKKAYGTVRRAVREAVQRVRAKTSRAEIEAALRAGDVRGAVDAVRFELGQDYLREAVSPSVRAIYEQSARHAADRMSTNGLSVRFDIFNPEAVSYVGRATGDMIDTWGESSKEGLRSMVSRAITEGRTPSKLARDIREDGIGLTERQTDALENYRRSLEDGDNPYTNAQIDELVGRKAEEYERARSEMIAHTEVMEASRAGNQELWRQAAERGLIDRSVAEQVWKLSNNPCKDCKAVVEAGGTAKLGEEFPADGGDGPPLHPHCECVVVLMPFGAGGKD